MAKSGWCVEGRHIGTEPVYSKPCPLTKDECSCVCHIGGNVKKQKKIRRKK